jgi:hypothetical protein
MTKPSTFNCECTNPLVHPKSGGRVTCVYCGNIYEYQTQQRDDGEWGRVIKVGNEKPNHPRGLTLETTERGFERLMAPHYPQGHMLRLAQQSSAIDVQVADSFARPGMSYLWIGEHHHLNRTEVQQLTQHLIRWLQTGSLKE